MTIKSILGKMFVNDKQIVVLDDTAENGGIESGSNANGSYVKFPDGTLTCTGLGGGVGITSKAITFAHAFTEAPIVTYSTTTAINTIILTDNFSATTTGMTFTSNVSGEWYAKYIAIGRWK